MDDRSVVPSDEAKSGLISYRTDPLPVVAFLKGFVLLVQKSIFGQSLIVAAVMRQITNTRSRLLCASMPMLSWHGSRDDNRGMVSAGGSAFLVRTPSRILGVTAGHVVNGFTAARSASKDLKATLGGLSLDLQERLIALSDEVDIATFDVEDADLLKIGFRPLGNAWPPAAPSNGGPVLLAGWPGQERVVGPQQITGGIYVGWGAAGVTDRQITIRVDLDQGAVSPLPRVPLPPQGFDFSGISGGPLMTISAEGTNVIWRLGGVIVEGKPDYNYIVAAHADVIRDDGTLRPSKR
jgi:hypothetical protein